MNLQGQTIVIFSLFRHDSVKQSTSFAFAKQLSVDNQVFYFDNPYTFNDVIRKWKSAAFARRRDKFGLFSTKSIAHPDFPIEIFILPVLLSIHFLPEGKFYRALLKINEFLIRAKIRRVLKKRLVSDFVFINSFNFHYPNVAKGLHPRLSVYQCLDPVIGAFDGRHGTISESRLVQNSDLIVCSSKQLFTEKRALNPNTYFIPNAADLEHSQTALNPDLPVSPLLAGIPSPIVGYLGSIEYRMDFPLLDYLAKHNRDMSFVFVGPVSGTLPASVLAAPNVYFPGPVPFAETPRVLKGFDLCIIPFKKNDHSATVFPLKLFEYLGAAKPVVISDFNPDLRDFTLDSLAICATPAAFSEAVRQALESDSDELRKKRIDIAALNTWQHRARELSDLLVRTLDGSAIGNAPKT